MERPSPVGGGMLECAISPGTRWQPFMCVQMRECVPGVYDVSSAQATQLHNIDNCVVLGEHCGGSAVATRVVGVVRGTSRASGQGLGRTVVVAGAGGVHTAAGTSCGSM